MRWVENLIFSRLGHDAFGDGMPCPPGDGLSIRVGPSDRHPDGTTRPIYVVNTSNDGFELWIGTDDRWYWHCRREDAHRIARFVVWRWWVVGEWCGLRRWLWSWALGRRVERTNRIVEEARSRAQPGDRGPA